MIGARVGDEDAAGSQQFERSKIDLFVSTERGLERLATLRERRRIEHDRVEALSRGLEVLEEVEDVGLYDLEFFGCLVQASVTLYSLHGIRRSVDGDDVLAASCHMQRERALIGEAVQRAALRVAPGRGPVLSLVEEGPCLLSLEQVYGVLNPVFFDDQLSRILSRQNPRD